MSSLPPYFSYSGERKPRHDKLSLLFICDHASSYIPSYYNNLGLSKDCLKKHIAYDIGAKDITITLAQYFGVPYVISHFSRLLIDPNRGEVDPTLIMKISDGKRIPYNNDITSQERQKRITTFYRPYHNAITQAIVQQKKKQKPLIVISIHSFTPQFNKKKRMMDAALLWDDYSKNISKTFYPYFAQSCINDVIAGNQPYQGGLPNDTLDRHCSKFCIDSLLFEYRQDHVCHDKGITLWCEKTIKALDNFIVNNYT